MNGKGARFVEERGRVSAVEKRAKEASCELSRLEIDSDDDLTDVGLSASLVRNPACAGALPKGAKQRRDKMKAPRAADGEGGHELSWSFGGGGRGVERRRRE